MRYAAPWQQARGARTQPDVSNDGGLLTKLLLLVENAQADQTVIWVRMGYTREEADLVR